MEGRDPLLERRICLLFQYSESSKFSRRKVLVVKRSEIESTMSSKAVVGNDLGSEVEVLLVLFPTSSFKLFTFLLQTCL